MTNLDKQFADFKSITANLENVLSHSTISDAKKLESFWRDIKALDSNPFWDCDSQLSYNSLKYLKGIGESEVQYTLRVLKEVRAKHIL